MEIAEILLRNGMSQIDHQDVEGDTPLHWAVTLNKPDTVSFLLAHGAQKDATNSNLNSPLMLACLNQNLQIVKIILAQTRSDEESVRLTNQTNRTGMTPLHASCLLGDILICDTLIK